MDHTIELFAGKRSDGSSVNEQVLVEPLGGTRYLLLRSPGVVLGLAAGDEFDTKGDGGFEIVRRGRNLCIQILFSPEPATLEPEAAKAFANLGGRLDGGTKGLLVYTVPVAVGFPAVEAVLSRLVSAYPGVEWYYGNVYDPKDGITPLNWW
jgi:hypothetical protein